MRGIHFAPKHCVCEERWLCAASASLTLALCLSLSLSYSQREFACPSSTVHIATVLATTELLGILNYIIKEALICFDVVVHTSMSVSEMVLMHGFN